MTSRIATPRITFAEGQHHVAWDGRILYSDASKQRCEIFRAGFKVGLGEAVRLYDEAVRKLTRVGN